MIKYTFMSIGQIGADGEPLTSEEVVQRLNEYEEQNNLIAELETRIEELLTNPKIYQANRKDQ